ncbi:uncharacterized protein LOC123904385 [Trifolium pratense]|uniref:uncharacterized protein LOC123904385 n=1 Tax=Trifolium pratense TaxID=57577 RepID=UPI001E695FD8|nr:uncharacterized protein LOC123904385 [Trifolium pratense]
MSVLVNGSPTEDFNVGKGLRQRDPLSPFMFLIVDGGLTSLMHRAVDNSIFQGYKVSKNISFHTLQFADHTIIVGDGNWDNLWTIKIVLRSFEIVSGLKVNFYKSKLYGIKLEDNFLRASLAYLHCEVESIPFRFLGIRVGANSRRRATWLPIIESMKKRLCAWNGRNLSIGEWTAKLSKTETVAAHDILSILEAVRPRREVNDRRRWISHTAGFFTVKTVYIWLCKTGLVHMF